jgi:hypothetical protein
MTAAEFELDGTMTVLAFEPLNGFLNAGTDTHLMLAVGGCPFGPLVAGRILVYDGTIGVTDTSWGQIKDLYR